MHENYILSIAEHRMKLAKMPFRDLYVTLRMLAFFAVIPANVEIRFVVACN
jgi:hypothetical protein